MGYLKEHPIEKDWITKTITEKTVKYADNFARYLANEEGGSIALTTSQLRKFFGSVKALQVSVKAEQTQADWQAELVMLKPKLAYAEGRAKQKDKNKTLRISDFREVIDKALDYVNEQTNKDKEVAFMNFVSFFEAIVAYHKAYGKDS